MEDIQALGGNALAVRQALAPFSVRMMVAYANYAIERISPYAMLGMVHVLEGMSVALARAAASAIQTSLGVSGASGGFSYLTSHGQLDEDHVAAFAVLLDRIDTSERRSIVIQAAKDFYQLFGNVFRELDEKREKRHAL